MGKPGFLIAFPSYIKLLNQFNVKRLMLEQPECEDFPPAQVRVSKLIWRFKLLSASNHTSEWYVAIKHDMDTPAH